MVEVNLTFPNCCLSMTLDILAEAQSNTKLSHKREGRGVIVMGLIWYRDWGLFTLGIGETYAVFQSVGTLH